jgi:anti-sigma regulatory factor (Ser/Thr protein kinase)
MDDLTNCRSAMFSARLSELRQVGGFLDQFCTASAITRERYLRLNVVLEELFVNTVRHGHGGDCDAPVWITLNARPDAAQVIYEDTAPPFNPYAHLPASLPDSTLEMRKVGVGGLGVLLTKELADTRDYAYLFGRNRIRLLLKR